VAYAVDGKPKQKTFTALNEGVNSKTITAIDLARNSSSQLVVLQVDTVPPTGSLVINNDATYATTTAVTLNLTGVDTTSGLDQMRFSSDGGMTWSGWETFVTTKSLTLSADVGTKTIQCQLKIRQGWFLPLFQTRSY